MNKRTVEQWLDILEKAKRDDTFVTLASGMFGEVIFHVWQDALYPGTSAEHLASINGKQLPLPGVDREGAWAVFTTYSHTEENLRKAKFHGKSFDLKLESYCY